MSSQDIKETSSADCNSNEQTLLPSGYHTPKICEGCDTVVTDLYINKVVCSPGEGAGEAERYWHERCLRCCMCGQQLATKCYERAGRLYCNTDYHKLFSGRCSHCHKAVENMDMVMRSPTGHYYHTPCFRCSACNCLLSTGDLYSVNPYTGWIYCQYHSTETNGYDPHQLAHASSIPPTHSSGHQLSGQPFPTCPGPSGNVKSDMMPYLSDQISYWSDDASEDKVTMSSCAKGDKRPRTVLSASQRLVLKHAFDLDPKPSKKARHVMAIETGLSNRVVQVWFQNQRAKMKKRQKNGIFNPDSPLSPAIDTSYHDPSRDTDHDPAHNAISELSELPASQINAENTNITTAAGRSAGTVLYSDSISSPYSADGDLTPSGVNKSVIFPEEIQDNPEHLLHDQILLQDSKINQHSLSQYCY